MKSQKITLKKVYDEMYFQYKNKSTAIEETLYYFVHGWYTELSEEVKQILREYIQANI